MGDRAALGAAGVPSGAAKVEEAEVCLLLSERVRVDAKREGCPFGLRVNPGEESELSPQRSGCAGESGGRCSAARCLFVHFEVYFGTVFVRDSYPRFW
jgi:hypothetical protein